MRINIHAGHNPDGRTACGAVSLLRESTEARLVKDKVITYLKELGHTVYDCTVDNASMTYWPKSSETAIPIPLTWISAYTLIPAETTLPETAATAARKYGYIVRTAPHPITPKPLQKTYPLSGSETAE